MLYWRQTPDGATDLLLVPVEGGQEPSPLLAIENFNLSGRISPDGKRLLVAVPLETKPPRS